MASSKTRVRRAVTLLLWLVGLACLGFLASHRSIDWVIWLPYIVLLACLVLHATMHAPVHRRRRPPRSP